MDSARPLSKRPRLEAAAPANADGEATASFEPSERTISNGSYVSKGTERSKGGSATSHREAGAAVDVDGCEDGRLSFGGRGRDAEMEMGGSSSSEIDSDDEEGVGSRGGAFSFLAHLGEIDLLVVALRSLATDQYDARSLLVASCADSTVCTHVGSM